MSARGPAAKSRGRAYLNAACALGAASLSIAWVGLGWLAATPAQAQSNYPWCAYYGGGNYGTNCGFTTFEQCLDTVRGIGGFCQLNDWYKPPAPSAHSRHRALRP